MTKNLKRNLKELPKTPITLSLQMRYSIYFRLRPTYTYERGHFILSETVFKKYFFRYEPFLPITFLVEDTRLYTLPCRLVGRSVGRSVGSSVTFLNSARFSHYCSCPTVRDWIAVCPVLFIAS